ncbi:hypothetical protein PflCFBP13517_26390 [Pseudomonas fluorescens]|nr:hypothetical protein PflCFBP13517_26390 [Pseudomonas fluorescens]
MFGVSYGNQLAVHFNISSPGIVTGITNFLLYIYITVTIVVLVIISSWDIMESIFFFDFCLFYNIRLLVAEDRVFVVRAEMPCS